MKLRPVLSALLLALCMMGTMLLARAAVGIDPGLRPDYAPQGYSEIYTPDAENAGNNFSNRSITYIIADAAVVLIQISGVLAIYFLVTAGLTYVKSFGRDEEIQKAKKSIIWSIVGLLIIITSYAIVQNVIKITLSVDESRVGNL